MEEHHHFPFLTNSTKTGAIHDVISDILIN